MAEVGEVKVRIGADTTELESSLRKGQASLEKFGEQIAKLGAQISTLVSLPLAMLGRQIAKVGEEYEKTMQEIIGLTGAAEESVKEWKKEILDLARIIGKSPTELSRGLYFIVSAGLEGDKAFQALTASAMASAAGLGDVNTVADAVTSALNAYREANLTAAEATSILIDTVKYGKAEPAELASSIGQVLPVAAQLGVGFNEVGASIASLTLTGLSASESVTALRGVLTTILQPSAMARKQLEQAGLSADLLRKIIKEKGLLAALTLLAQTFKDNDEAIATIFGNVRALVGMLALTGENAKAVQEIFRKMGNVSSDSLVKAFEAIENTAAFKMARARASIEANFIAISEKLLPILASAFEKAANVINTLVDAFNKLPSPMQNLIINLGLIATVAGPSLILLGTFVKLISNLKTVITLLIPKLIELANSFALLISDPKTFLIILALGIGALLAYKNNILGLRDVINDAITSLNKDLSEGFNLKSILSSKENLDKASSQLVSPLQKTNDDIKNITSDLKREKELYNAALTELYEEAEAQAMKQMKESILNKAIEESMQELSKSLIEGREQIYKNIDELNRYLSSIEISYNLSGLEKLKKDIGNILGGILKTIDDYGNRIDKRLDSIIKNFRPWEFLKTATKIGWESFWEGFWGKRKEEEIKIREIKIPELPELVIEIKLPPLEKETAQLGDAIKGVIADKTAQGIREGISKGAEGAVLPPSLNIPFVPPPIKLQFPFPDYEFVGVPDKIVVPLPRLEVPEPAPIYLPYPRLAFSEVPDRLLLPLPRLEVPEPAPIYLPYPKVIIPAIPPIVLPPPIFTIEPIPEPILIPLPKLEPITLPSPQNIEFPIIITIKEILKTPAEIAQQIINTILELIPLIQEELKKLAESVKDKLMISVTLFVKFLISLWQTIKDTAKMAYDYVLEKIKAIQEEFNKLLNTAKNTLILSAKLFISFVYSLFKKIEDIAKDIYNFLSEKVKEIKIEPVIIQATAIIGLVLGGLMWLGKQLFTGGQLATQPVLPGVIYIPAELDLKINEAFAKLQLKEIFKGWQGKQSWEDYWGKFVDNTVTNMMKAKKSTEDIIKAIIVEIMKYSKQLNIANEEQARAIAINLLIWRGWADELALHSIVPDVAEKITESLDVVNEKLEETKENLEDFITTVKTAELYVPEDIIKMTEIANTYGIENYAGDVALSGMMGGEGNIISAFAEKVFGYIRNAAYSAGQALDRFIQNIVDIMTPFAILEALLNELNVKTAFINSLLKVVEPVLKGLLYPFTYLGQVVGKALIPVLEALWPVFRFLGLVVGGIVLAFMYIYNFLAGMINFITLGTAGLKYIDTKPVVDALNTLSTMTWEQAQALAQANDALEEFTDGLINAPQGFKVALARYEAIEPVKLQTGGIVKKPTLALVGEKGEEAVIPLSKAGSLTGDVINIEAIYISTDDPEEFWKALKKTIERKKFISKGTTILQY